MLATQERTGQVDAEHEVPVLDRSLVDPPVAHRAGIGNEAREQPEFADGRVHHRRHLSFVGDVARDGERSPTFGAGDDCTSLTRPGRHRRDPSSVADVGAPHRHAIGESLAVDMQD